MNGFEQLKQAAELLEAVAEDLALPGISNRLSTAAALIDQAAESIASLRSDGGWDSDSTLD
jgi:hypothetical protein